MPSPDLKVSVILLSYNYAEYLDEAITSVLEQTYPAQELILVDDGSSDASWALLMQWQARYPGLIKLFAHPGRAHQGLIASYMLALSKVSGDIVAFIESDDVWKKNNLLKKINVFKEAPEAGVVYADYEPFGLWRGVFYWGLYAWTNRLTTPARRPFFALPVFLKRNTVASFTHFAARSKFLTAVERPSLHTKNFDWWVLTHLASAAPFYFIPERLTRWRIHARSAAYGRITRESLKALSFFLIACYRSLLAKRRCPPSCERRMYESFYFIKAFQTHRNGYVLRKMLRYPVSTLRFFVHVILRNCLFPERALEMADIPAEGAHA